MARQPRHALAARILSRLDQLSAISAGDDLASRGYLSAGHKAAIRLASGWMRDSGLTVHLDAAGTLYGRAEGTARGAKTLLLGSNIICSLDLGPLDACLGLVVALESVSELRRLGIALPYAVEIVGFGDVAGSRFGLRMTGPRAMAKDLPPGWLDATDDTGTSLREALRAFGGTPERIDDVARNPSDLIGYLEVHLERGSVLDKERHAVGVVTAISGFSRSHIEVRGKTDHAGATPVHNRRDALAAAAEMIGAVEQVGRQTTALFANVTGVSATPASPDLVPGEVTFLLDVRSPLDRVRRSGVQDIERQFRNIARRRQLTVKLTELEQNKAVECDHRFISKLTTAAESLATVTIGLPSGSTHAGLVLARVCPVGMLSVRNRGNGAQLPERAVRAEDIEIATRLLIETLRQLAPNGRTLA
jgi:allantoate deiminase